MTKTIEITSKTDKSGHLRLDYNLDISEKKVRILIMLDDENKKEEFNDEESWLISMSKNPSFNFLNDLEEEIYSLEDGDPFND